MMGYKLFTLEEARQLVPTMRALLQEANDDLAELMSKVEIASERYEMAEKRLGSVKTCNGPVANLSELRVCRSQFQEAIELLSKAQNEYVRRLNAWVEKITQHGVILRDLRSGLLDFPAEKDGFEYLLCWRIDEPDIHHWHLANDGFVGRKPLATLEEYC